MTEIVQKHLMKNSAGIEEPTPGELLAYCEGFLIGMARRIDQAYTSSPVGAAMSEDCRALAARIGIVKAEPTPKAPA